MEWNDFNNSLLYYLANLYLADPADVVKKKLVISASMQAIKITWGLSPLSTWILILEMAYNSNKIVALLEKAIADQGEPEDEFLASALKNIIEKKNVRHVELKSNDWKGGGYNNEVKEKIIGKKSTLLPIGFLEAGTDAAKSVVRIDCGDDMGTGFLIENGWLLTNNHVIPSREVARKAKIQLGFQYPKGMRADDRILKDLKPELEITLNPGSDDAGDFFTSPEEDWTMIKIGPDYAGDLLPYRFLNFSNKDVGEGDFVNIIQHPLGGPKQIGIYNNLVMYVDDQIVQYMTDTNAGSSGSPVMNSDWEVVAIHHSGGWLIDPKTNESVRRNQGTNIQKIKQFIAGLS